MFHLAICTKVVRLWGNPRRGFPTAEQSPRLFCAPPALFGAQEFRSLRTAPRALPLDPTVFLKKDGQKLSAFCYRKTVYLHAEYLRPILTKNKKRRRHMPTAPRFYFFVYPTMVLSIALASVIEILSS